MDPRESGLKLRISRMFRAPFGSCRSRHISDVVEKAVIAPQGESFHSIMSPKERTFPSICKPRCPDSAQPIINHTCIRVSKEALRRRKICISDPASPLADFYAVTHKKNRKKKKKPRGRRSSKSIKLEAFPFGCASNESYSVRNSWWFSSEDETDNLFSSRSLSSDSSEYVGRRTKGSSVAVVKRSSDPYSDFRTSMVEMIVEKQIFGTEELEELLQCFLSLNTEQHHKIILEVFTEIWEALFCD